MLLALLNSLLNCEQLRVLKLTKSEAGTLVSMLNLAVQDPYHLAQGSTLLTVLRAMIWFTHEYRPSKIPDKKEISEHEIKLNYVTHELKSNLQLLVNEGVVLALNSVLNIKGQEELQATAARLVWSLAHDAHVKKTSDDTDIVRALQDVHTFPSFQMASHSALKLIGFLPEGMFIDNKLYILQ